MAMIKLKRVLAPVNGVDFNDICSFTTETCIGIYDHGREEWLLIEREAAQFDSCYLGCPGTLEELDDAVYAIIGEHIEGVSTSSTYSFALGGEEE